MAVRNSRYRRRRGRSGFLYKLLSVLLILAAVIAGCIVFFRVEEITVKGSTVYTDEQVAAAAGVEQGDNLFLVNKILVGRKIVSQLPYISEVNLRRVLPKELVFTVTECTPVGIVQGEDGSWWVLDTRCKLLEQGGSELESRYPVITGLTPLLPDEGEKLAVSVEESAKLNALKQILAALENQDMLERVRYVDLTGAADIYIGYDDRFDVRMALYSDNFDYLILVVRQAAASERLIGQTGTLDLTFDDGSAAHFIPD